MKRASFRGRIIIMATLVTGLSLGAAFLINLAAWYGDRRASMIDEVGILADVVAENLTAALEFEDERGAEEKLAPLRLDANIQAAWVRLPTAEVFATFPPWVNTEAIAHGSIELGHRFENGILVITRPIVLEGERLGTLRIDYGLDGLRAEVMRGGLTNLLLFGAGLGLAVAIATSLQRGLTRPVLELAGTARRVAAGGDYSVRAQKFSTDELGDLTDSFNTMLAEIEHQNKQLRQAKDELEVRVEVRTQDLRRAKNKAESAAAALGRKNAVVQLLHEVAVAANEAPTPDEATERTLRKLCRSTGWVAGHVFHVAPSGDSLVSSGIWHVEDEIDLTAFRAATERLVLHPGEELGGRVLATGEEVWVGDIQQEPSINRGAEGGSTLLHSALAFPVMAGAKLAAVVELFSTRTDEADAELLATVAQIGTQLGRVFERDRSQRERRELTGQLVETSRRAGMAEVATGVLHNVGNVLNTINVSAAVVSDTVRNSSVTDIGAVAELLAAHDGELGSFMTDDEKGKLIPRFLAELSRHLADEQETVQSEMALLRKSLEHVEDIVSRQQSLATRSSVLEYINMHELINDAVTLQADLLERHRVRFVTDIAEVPAIRTDRHVILQILINLITNARQAVADEAEPVVTAAVSRRDEKTIRITVSDNGIGILAENLTRIFQHGFTTRADGHGFGLHHSAVEAKRLGGELRAASEGLGHGAALHLDLPLQPVETRADHA